MSQEIHFVSHGHCGSIRVQNLIIQTGIASVGDRLSPKVVKKITILGPPAVGKTSLIQRYVNDVFDTDYRSTVGAHVVTKEVQAGDITVVLTIWDLAGQPTSRTLSKSHYLGSGGSLLIFDLTRPETLEELSLWAAELERAVGHIPLILIGNKSDLEYPADSSERMLRMATRLDARYFMTSAKESINVNDAFETLARQMVL